MNVLESNFRVIITIGKSKDVPVVIPKVLFKSLDFLSDVEVRKKAAFMKETSFSSLVVEEAYCLPVDRIILKDFSKNVM